MQKQQQQGDPSFSVGSRGKLRDSRYEASFQFIVIDKQLLLGLHELGCDRLGSITPVGYL